MYKIAIQFTGTGHNHTVDTGSMVNEVPSESSDWVGVLAAIVSSVPLDEEDRDILRDLI